MQNVKEVLEHLFICFEAVLKPHTDSLTPIFVETTERGPNNFYHEAYQCQTLRLPWTLLKHTSDTYLLS